MIAAYADGLVDRHEFIDLAAAWDTGAEDVDEPDETFVGDVRLPQAGTMADIERAYVAGLIDTETFRDIHVARRLREEE